MVQILSEVIIAESGTHHSDASAPTNNSASSWETRPSLNMSDGLLELDLYHIFRKGKE